MRDSSHKGKPRVKQPRLQQKERTRQALLESARQLVDVGEEAPTIARVAAHAGVSQATAYRYYSDTLLLLRDAFSGQWPELPAMVEQLGTLRDAGSRARAAAEAMARHVLAREPFVRTVLRLALESGENARPAFRFLLIDRVLEVATGDAAEKRALRLGLATLISAEAVFALKDTRECDDEELVATLGWAAERLAKRR